MKTKELLNYFNNGSINSKYFLEGSEKFNFKTDSCKLVKIKEAFGIDNLSCAFYDDVVNGEGNEKEKIDTIYSSSLQSLLFFSQVNKENVIKIKIDGIDHIFNKVVFEYKNKVIGYPSSIDVVLINDGTHEIAFIESKLLEIIRDSSEIGKKVVGISYFKKDGAYDKVLGLKKEELKSLGIDFESDYLEKVKGLGENKKIIDKLSGNTYVYSEGIKQVLAHLVGIVNFKSNHEDHFYKENEDRIKDHEHYVPYYVELYNSLPDFEAVEPNYKDMLKDFINHVGKIKELNEKHNWVKDFVVLTYQNLLENNKEYKINESVKKYYHL